MKTSVKILTLAMAMAFLMAGSAMAYNLGENLTIPDKMATSEDWHTAQEDQEVEPGMAHGQLWDLEGMFLNGTTLNIVGGFDFVKGGWGELANQYFRSGDLFVDVDNNALYGNASDGSPIPGGGSGNQIETNSFGYDYVFDLDFASNTFSLYAINADSLVTNVYYDQNRGSNPWRYASGGTLIGQANVRFDYQTGFTDDAIGNGLTGGLHNVVSIDLATLFAQSNVSQERGITFHITEECGNDNLMGRDPVVPEPATILLLGAGIIGLVGFRRKFNK